MSSRSRNQRNKLRRDQFYNFVNNNIGRTLPSSQKQIFKEYLFKIAGIFYGCALGEILGTHGHNKSHKRMISDFPDLVTFPTENRRGIPPGKWAENTSQLILMMDMLADNEENEYGSNWEIDLNSFAKKLKKWNKNGFRKLGDNCGLSIDDVTSRVINKPHFINDPQAVAIETYRELGSNRAPNGSLIRGVLTAFLSDHERAALDMTTCTHADPRCLAATTVIDLIISFLLRCNVNELSIEWMTDNNIAKYILEPARKYIKNSKRNNLISEYDKYAKIALMPLIKEENKSQNEEKLQEQTEEEKLQDQNSSDQEGELIEINTTNTTGTPNPEDEENINSNNDDSDASENIKSKKSKKSKKSRKREKRKDKKRDKSVQFEMDQKHKNKKNTKKKKRPHLGFLPMGGLDDESDSLESSSDLNNETDVPEDTGTLLGNLRLDDMEKKDYCLKAMVCAIWGFRKVRDFIDNLMYEAMETGMSQLEAHEKSSKFFKETISEIVKRGGDAKTNAALVGAVLGCSFGYVDLPDDWVLDILNKEWSDQKLKNLFWSL